MKTINALSARSRLGTILNEVSQEGEHYVIERLREPLAVMVPVDEYEELFSQRKSKKQEKQKEELLKLLSRFRKKYGKKIAGREGTTELIRKMREERTKHLTKALRKP